MLYEFCVNEMQPQPIATRLFSNFLAAVVFLLSVSLVGCSGSTEAVKLESPDGVDWPTLEKQEETLASEMNRNEK